MEAATTLAKKQNCHKMILITGTTLDARKFYEKVGFKHSGDLPNYFLNHDFVEYTKFI